MSPLFDWFIDEDGCRLTGIWRSPWIGDAEATGLRFLASRVDLGKQDDGAVEASFISSHLPWSFGGIHGVDPAGTPWLIVLQLAPEPAGALVGSAHPYWVMADGLDRALRRHGEAAVWDQQDGVGLDRRGLIQAYIDADIDHGRVAEWPTTDLVNGLLAACTPVSLEAIVAGYDTDCCFPDAPHDCQHDVFTDAFTKWSDDSP